MVLVAGASFCYFTAMSVSQLYVTVDWFTPVFIATSYGGVLLLFVAYALRIKASTAEVIDEYYWNGITDPPERS